jgi:hypothetical protein
MKACCFTNFKLSRAHVIHIYKYLRTSQKTSFFILFQVFDGRYREKHTLDGFQRCFSVGLKFPTKNQLTQTKGLLRAELYLDLRSE